LAAGTKPSRIEKQKRAIKLLALADECSNKHGFCRAAFGH
jgi:hypothetical protein